MTTQSSDDNLKLDQKEFAKMIVNSHRVSDELDPEAIVKRKLTIYLTAYYLAEKFNNLQDETYFRTKHKSGVSEIITTTSRYEIWRLVD